MGIYLRWNPGYHGCQYEVVRPSTSIPPGPHHLFSLVVFHLPRSPHLCVAFQTGRSLLCASTQSIHLFDLLQRAGLFSY
ncbi:hypothetical protein BGZ63DRAFT_388851 [Mariannaea sp. PMI_226]|nr:hypothetical protein BGZ63DRAFT_388851 [Mariannaea sp. PMI_226]